jgi:lactate racemase
VPLPQSVRAGDAGTLDPDDFARFLHEALTGAGLDGASVLLVVPDATRTMPLPLVLSALWQALHGKVTRLTVLIALGTHRPLSEPELDVHCGVEPGTWATRYPGVDRLNHEWWRPEAFVTLGELDRDTVRQRSGGRLDETIVVRINRLAVEHDVVLIAGPVFPHEVVGFSGGTKYLFPGIGGQEMIDSSHWLGALVGVGTIIGAAGTTPVRALINQAAELLPTRQLCLAVVVSHDGVHGAFLDTPVPAQAAAAQLSAEVHVTRVPRPYRRILSIVPSMYDDIWTGAKGVYKLDPVTADGGEIVLYAPHVSQLSSTHGEDIRRVGYHCLEYLTGHPDLMITIPRGVLAHSAHVHGDGTYDPVRGERRRIRVTLATAIPRVECEAVNLGYLDPADVDIDDWRDDPDTLVVPHAGEQLYRLG